MKQIYNRHFPTPSYLAMSSCALDISDKSIKYGELVTSEDGLYFSKFGVEHIPSGVIVSGKIENENELVRILKNLAKREKMHFVRISLPEEQMYLFTIQLPKISGADIRESILLQLEEHIPLKAVETIFDYEVISENEKTIFIEVLAVASATIDSYVSILERSGLVPLSFELEAQAIARAVIPVGDTNPVMIVDFGEARTGASIVRAGRVFFATTLDIGGITITEMIAKSFSISFEEAEKMKRSYGLSSTEDPDDILPAIINGISVLRDELNRHYVYWKTHEEDGVKHEKLDRIILCGGEANLSGLSNYLEGSMKMKVESANVWINVTSMKDSVPDVPFEESFGYATVVGLALADHVDKSHTRINVLPEELKKNLRKEYWFRFTSLITSFVALAGVIATILILPAYFFALERANFANSSLEKFNLENPEITNTDLNKSIDDINKKVTILATKKNKPIVEDLLLKNLILTKPDGITLSNIAYNEGTVKTLNITGQAKDRVTLRNFKASLDTNPNIAEATLPISDFLDKANIDFNIAIKMK